jgi:tetratricopeptide (TPR) repeat protein
MVNELWPRDRPLARTLFAQAIRVLEHRGTPNQRHEVLLGVLKNEVREGRWDLAASVLARIKESNRGEHPLALEVKELAARTLAGRHDYLNAAMTLGEIIAQKEALTREFPDDRLSRELPDNRFMLVCQYAAAGRIREAEAALERAENCLNPDRIANLHHLVGVRELDVNPRSPRSGSHFRYILKKYPDTRWAKLAAAGLKVIGNPEGPSGPSDP